MSASTQAWRRIVARRIVRQSAIEFKTSVVAFENPVRLNSSRFVKMSTSKSSRIDSSTLKPSSSKILTFCSLKHNKKLSWLQKLLTSRELNVVSLVQEIEALTVTPIGRWNSFAIRRTLRLQNFYEKYSVKFNLESDGSQLF